MTFNIELSWSEFKAQYLIRATFMQCVEKTYEYLIFLEDSSIVFNCLIPKTDPASSDQADFETNFKANCNKPLSSYVKDGKPSVVASSRPINTETCFTTQADDIVNGIIGEGKRMCWDFSNTDDDTTAPSGYKRKRFVLKFIDPIYIKEGTLYYFNTKKGSYGDVYVVCPTGYPYYDNNGDMQYATEPTKVTHYVIKHPMQDSVPMGDELNTEEVQENPLPIFYELWIEVTVPDNDVDSNGCVELELYRARTVVL